MTLAQLEAATARLGFTPSLDDGGELLRDAAAKIGYDYAYVSKFFKRKTDMSFRQYVNRLRIIEGKKLLSSTADSVEHVAYACGFSSLRAFDREFFAQIGVTPSAYRLSKKSTTV